VYGFHFQQRNPRTLPIESLAHDYGCTLVRAEYGYLKGSALNTVLTSVHTQMTITELHGATTQQQAIAKTPAK
jgi:hypothetical protein